MKRGLQACAVLLLCAASAHAQLYKWTGPDGKVTYSDTPPTAPAARIEAQPAAPEAANTAGLPYELAQAVKSHPVALYTAKDCTACDDGRSLLVARGIPFAEKTVATNEDAAFLRQTGGDGKLPVLIVGRAREPGFDAGAWHRALTAAGYPETSRLPKAYRNPPPVAAAPAQQPKPAAGPASQPATANRKSPAPSTAAEPLPAAGNAPPGFRF